MNGEIRTSERPSAATEAENPAGALEELFLHHRDRVFRLALRYVRFPQDAEDVVQETFLKAFSALATFDPSLGSGLNAWLNQICVNCAIDHLRSRRRRSQMSLDALPQEPASSAPSPEDIVIERRVSRGVHDAAGVLSPRQRVIFALRYREHMEIRQIAVRLECSEGNIRAHLFRSASKLRNHFLPPALAGQPN